MCEFVTCKPRDWRTLPLLVAIRDVHCRSQEWGRLHTSCLQQDSFLFSSETFHHRLFNISTAIQFIWSKTVSLCVTLGSKTVRTIELWLYWRLLHTVFTMHFLFLSLSVWCSFTFIQMIDCFMLPWKKLVKCSNPSFHFTLFNSDMASEFWWSPGLEASALVWPIRGVTTEHCGTVYIHTVDKDKTGFRPVLGCVRDFTAQWLRTANGRLLEHEVCKGFNQLCLTVMCMCVHRINIQSKKITWHYIYTTKENSMCIDWYSFSQVIRVSFIFCCR